jgi:hypothetical protein
VCSSDLLRVELKVNDQKGKGQGADYELPLGGN